MASAEVQAEVKGLEETQEKLTQVLEDLDGPPMVRAMRTATLMVQRDAKIFSPVDTGRLRASITPKVVTMAEVVEGVVGSNVSYACIFKSHARIVTEDGGKTIGQIQVGDKVLAQDGNYRRVTATYAFPATEKPDLVDIEIAWRKDRTHKLTVTADHKILTHRDGRNKWIKAGELKPTDRLYSRRKLAHNKGTGQATMRVCANCSKMFLHGDGYQNRVYCSLKCRKEHWRTEHNPHFGMKRSQAAREKMSRLMRRRLRERPETHPNRVLAQRGYVTDCERQVKEWLDGCGVEYEAQKSIGRHIVDFYIPAAQTVFEADGAFWHQDQSKDIKRDGAIKAKLPDANVVHIHFTDERFTPDLKANPLPDVYYVAVNPGMKSYADVRQFETREILALHPWRYERPKGKGGAKVPKLYDLTVEGMHSFFANGILVSNSYQELGTKHMKGRKFLQRAFDRNKERIYRLFEQVTRRIINK